MMNESQSFSQPLNQPEFVASFRFFSRFSFWIQLALGAVSGIALLFAMFSRNMTEQTNNAGMGFGIFLAIVGILLLCFRIFWDFRYRLLGRRMQAATPQFQPSREDVIKTLQIGLTSSLVGILIAFVASEETVAVVLAKTLAQPQTVAATYTPENAIRSLDVFVTLANVNMIGAHLCGAITSLGLLNWVEE
ncbi:MAG TPA: hypothetical protein DCY88_10640 [Cyanobacteria bacterium UBA11372]|nr:hypothetical protein [Cyanobacteria bacterium UBA11372]